MWSHPELSSHSVLVLTSNRLYLAPLTGTPKSETVAAIEAGLDLDQLLGSLATVVELAAIRRLTLDLLTNSLTIEYAGSAINRSRLRLTFSSSEAADACFTKIWRRLGDEFQLAPYQRDAWHSMRGPLALLAVILFLTAVMSGLLSVREDTAAARASHVNRTGADAPAEPGSAKILDWLNWRVVCGVGGVAAACSQVWLYRRLTAPPESLELIKA